MAGARVQYPMTELGSGRKFRVIGTGLTRAAAIAEANAKLAMTVGSSGQGTVSENLTIGEGGTANADTQFSDVELTLINGGGKEVTIHLENVTTAIGTGVDGNVDLTDPLVTDFATAYKDGSGAGGYVPFSGKFVP